ncbi:hypothetical protein F511_21118 [Dorcoceras hygrometricum]|uniref:Uncharacterized protein n=1 Tax=Dorcoceras hygrometricum TaxID=472368 RepID=A0A2Z7AZ42_9LAMI|nr:hypothetical protein F511_21118 [Dorcoceras hygrometricum]
MFLVDWAVKMRIRSPEFEISICDAKYHVSLKLSAAPHLLSQAAAAAARLRRKIVSGQFDEENPFVLISSVLLVQADEGVSFLVVDRIGDFYRNLPRRADVIVTTVGARHKCQQVVALVMVVAGSRRAIVRVIEEATRVWFEELVADEKRRRLVKWKRCILVASGTSSKGYVALFIQSREISVVSWWSVDASFCLVGTVWFWMFLEMQRLVIASGFVVGNDWFLLTDIYCSRRLLCNDLGEDREAADFFVQWNPIVLPLVPAVGFEVLDSFCRG